MATTVSKEKISGAFLGALAADSLALGAHWCYDNELIASKLGKVDKLLKPTLNTYHGEKQAGDQTHYGDQILVLLDSLKKNTKFSADEFSKAWVDWFKTSSSYKDGASKTTFENIEKGKSGIDAASTSEDISGASRIAPLVVFYANNESELIESAKTQTALTHNNPNIVAISEYFARVLYLVLHNESPSKALAIAAEKVTEKEVKEGIEKGLKAVSATADDEQTVRGFGELKNFNGNNFYTAKSCGFRGALPSVVYFVAKYETDYASALIQNTGVGGDSAARGLLIGAILGAHLGVDKLSWVADLKSKKAVEL